MITLNSCKILSLTFDGSLLRALTAAYRDRLSHYTLLNISRAAQIDVDGYTVDIIS